MKQGSESSASILVDDWTLDFRVSIPGVDYGNGLEIKYKTRHLGEY